MDISNRRLPRYEEGAKKFIEFAFSGCSADKLLRCPCRICKNNYFADQISIMEHLMLNGIWKEYRVWDHHGESVSDSEYSDDNMEDHDDYGLREMVNDFGNAVNANWDHLMVHHLACRMTRPHLQVLLKKLANFIDFLKRQTMSCTQNAVPSLHYRSLCK